MNALPLDEFQVTSIVRWMLGAPSATLVGWKLEPVDYRVINRITAGLYRVSGAALVPGAPRAWSIFLKALQHRSAELSSAFNSSDDPSHWNYWRRESHVYASDVLAQLPPGLGVPRRYALSEPDDQTVWLWMEDIRALPATAWSLSRFGLAARHLGQFQGKFSGAHPPPSHSWLSHKWLRAWVPALDAATLALLDDPSAWEHPLLRGMFAPTAGRAAQRLWHERERMLAAVEQLPQTLCHLDFWPPNMFARTQPDGRDQTVLIDWSQAGLGAFGEDIANLVLDSVWMQLIDSAALPAFERLALEGYLAGLRDAGWSGTERQVRLAYTLTGALRFGLLAGALLHQVHDPAQHPIAEQRYNRPFAQIVGQRAAVVAHALALADEGRALMR